MEEDAGAAVAILDADKVFLSTGFAVLKAVMEAIADTQNRFISAEFMRIVKSPELMGHVDEVMPYLYAAAYLSFAGREIDEENTGNVLKTVGFTPNKKILQLLEGVNMRSHLIYVYTYYFLLAMGREGTAEEILKLVKALGIEAGEEDLNDTLLFLKAPRQR